MSALDELVNPNNWDVEEQFMDGADLGYAEATYVGDAVYLAAAEELAQLRARLAELEGQNKTLVEPDYDCVYCKDTGKSTWILDGKKHTVQGCIYCGKRGKK